MQLTYDFLSRGTLLLLLIEMDLGVPSDCNVPCACLLLSVQDIKILILEYILLFC